MRSNILARSLVVARAVAAHRSVRWVSCSLLAELGRHRDTRVALRCSNEGLWSTEPSLVCGEWMQSVGTVTGAFSSMSCERLRAEPEEVSNGAI